MRRRFDEMNCAVAQTLEVLGDWWTLLIVRDALLGVRRFADFEVSLGISKNVLTQRLNHLVEHGIFERVDAGVHGTRFEYELTAKGKDLFTLMTALRQWGDRWIYAEEGPPLEVLDRRTGKPVPPLRVTGSDGKPLKRRDLLVRAGPGAGPELRKRLRSRER